MARKKEISELTTIQQEMARLHNLRLETKEAEEVKVATIQLLDYLTRFVQYQTAEYLQGMLNIVGIISVLTDDLVWRYESNCKCQNDNKKRLLKENK